MKAIIDEIKRLKTIALKNRNTQTIARKLINWLNKLNPISTAGAPTKVKYIWRGTQDQYDAITNKRDDTLYVVAGTGLGISENLGNAAFGSVSSFPQANNVATVALGNAAQANGQAAIAIGNGAVADGAFSYALGPEAQTTGQAAFVTGFGAIAGTEAVALGTGAEATGTWSTAIGNNSRATSGSDIALIGGKTEQDGKVAIGGGAISDRLGAMATSLASIEGTKSVQKEEYTFGDAYSTNSYELLGTISLQDGEMLHGTARITAFAPSTEETASYTIDFAVLRTASGSNVIAYNNVTIGHEDVAGWDAVLNFSGSSQVQFQVLGESGKEIYWFCNPVMNAIKLQ